MSFIRSLDMFPKVEMDFAKTTASGGACTLIAAFVACVLFVGEVRRRARRRTPLLPAPPRRCRALRPHAPFRTDSAPLPFRS